MAEATLSSAAVAPAKPQVQKRTAPIVPERSVAGRTLVLLIAIMTFLSGVTLGGVVLVQKSAIARLTRTLGTLLSSGVGLIEAIDISAKTSGNVVVEQALLRCKESVTAGRTFAAPLAKEKAFPEMVVQMISIGEQSGTLDVMLGKIADFYEDEVETAVKAMTSLLEPLLMVVLGGIIAILVIAMYLPIFNMAGAIQ